jgi:hypothetical protein
VSLQKSKTKIHISCDLWSSPNSPAILGVVAHYINGDGELHVSQSYCHMSVCLPSLFGLRFCNSETITTDINPTILPDGPMVLAAETVKTPVPQARARSLRPGRETHKLEVVCCLARRNPSPLSYFKASAS